MLLQHFFILKFRLLPRILYLKRVCGLVRVLCCDLVSLTMLRGLLSKRSYTVGCKFLENVPLKNRQGTITSNDLRDKLIFYFYFFSVSL